MTASRAAANRHCLPVATPIHVRPATPNGRSGLTGRWYYVRHSLDGDGLCLARTRQEAYAGEWRATISAQRCALSAARSRGTAMLSAEKRFAQAKAEMLRDSVGTDGVSPHSAALRHAIMRAALGLLDDARAVLR